MIYCAIYSLSFLCKVQYLKSLPPKLVRKINTSEIQNMKGFLRFIVAKVILLALASSFVSCHDLLFKTSACVAVDDANGGNQSTIILYIDP